MPTSEHDIADLHPETRRLLSRRSLLGAAGAGGAMSFLGLAVIGCASSDSTSTRDTTRATTGSGATATKGSVASDSLYAKLGGEPAITAVVAAFLKNVGADTRINRRFASTDLTKLQVNLVDQIGEATGGPEKYAGRSMKEVHAGMGITVAEFNALVEDLVQALDQYKVPKDVQQPLLQALGGMQPDIVSA